jgi:putative transposase
MGRGRVFNREFKLAAVRQVANGEKRPAQVCREHGIAEGLLLRWRREYEARGEVAFAPSQLAETETLERRIADLERLCGQLALENALLKKAARVSVARAPSASSWVTSLRSMMRWRGEMRSSFLRTFVAIRRTETE